MTPPMTPTAHTPRLSLVLAAAEVLGTRLRHVQPARTKDTEQKSVPTPHGFAPTRE